MERSGDELGVFCSWSKMQVSHGRLNVGVAQPLLDSPDICDADHPCPERMAQVMEAQLPHPGAAKRSLVPPAECGAIEVPTRVAHKNQVVLTRPVCSLPEPRQR